MRNFSCHSSGHCFIFQWTHIKPLPLLLLPIKSLRVLFCQQNTTTQPLVFSITDGILTSLIEPFPLFLKISLHTNNEATAQIHNACDIQEFIFQSVLSDGESRFRHIFGSCPIFYEISSWLNWLTYWNLVFSEGLCSFSNEVNFSNAACFTWQCYDFIFKGSFIFKWFILLPVLSPNHVL